MLLKSCCGQGEGCEFLTFLTKHIPWNLQQQENVALLTWWLDERWQGDCSHGRETWKLKGKFWKWKEKSKNPKSDYKSAPNRGRLLISKYAEKTQEA